MNKKWKKQISKSNNEIRKKMKKIKSICYKNNKWKNSNEKNRRRTPNMHKKNLKNKQTKKQRD